MFHTSNPSLSQVSPRSSNLYNYKSLNELSVRPTSVKVSRHSASTHHHDAHRTPPTTLRKSFSGRSIYSSPSYRIFPQISLDELVINGQWTFRVNYDDRLQLKSLGIENLVYTCYDIMYKTRESIQTKEKLSKMTNASIFIVQLEQFQSLTDSDHLDLKNQHCYHLMSILFEATSTHASISELIRIWREVGTHHHLKHRSIRRNPPPKFSHELAVKHLLRTPNDRLLQIAVHASLLSGFSRMDLQHFGDQLGIARTHFDMGTIKDSTKSFESFLQIFREQKLKVERTQSTVDIHRLPYRPRKKRGLNANVAGTKFAVVRQAADVFGFSVSADGDFSCNLIWNDTLISMDIVSSLKPYQKVNHFPTMSEISRKDLLAKNFDKVARHLPNEYDFTPRTWLFPNEYNSWYAYASNKPKKEACAYILKPNNGAMGHGIQVFCDYERIQPMDNYIIQEYVREPFLIDGFKFDLRIYALLTSCDPLRLFIFNNGLVRMSTEKYEIPNRKNSSHLFMHLTNYSVNKYNIDYQKSGPNGDNEKTGSKRSLKFLFEYLRSQGLDATTLWRDIQNIIIKTVFLAQPHLFSAYRMCRPGASPSSESVCFELLGFDILVDQKLKPWVLEVNRCPSFGTNEQIDFDIKMKLLLDTFELLRFRTSDRKKSLAMEKAEAQRRLYSNLTKPNRLLDDSSLLFSNGNHRDFRTRQKKISDLKEKLYLIQREAARETFENRHLGGFIRVFPVEDSIRMKELMTLLGKCFDILSSNKKDLSWSAKYYSRFKEEELLDQLAELEEQEQLERQQNPRLAFSAPSSKNNFSSWSYISLTDVSTNTLNLDRASPSASFASESSDENEDDHDGGKSEATVPSELTSKTTSSTQNFRLNNSLMKRFASQARTNLFRSTSISPAASRRQRQTPIQTSNTNPRPTPLLQSSPTSERKLPSSSSHQNSDRHRHQPSRLIPPNTNEKAATVTVTTLPKKQLNNQVSTPGRSSSFNVPRENLPSDQELARFYQMTLEQMHQLCIRYPNKSDDETRRIYSDILENWNKYRTSLGEFWLNRLDMRKRQAILKIVRNNVQQIMKQLWIHSTAIDQLPLTRHLLQLEQRLLNNNGQYLWELCQSKQISLESSVGKTSTRVTPIELACCHRFVELSKQALFIVYRYSLDEKVKRQQQQQQPQQSQQQKSDGSTVMVSS